MPSARRPVPRIAITVGDPAGVGPEVVKSALSRADIRSLAEFEVLGETTAIAPGEPTTAGARAAFEALEESVSRTLGGEFDAVVTGPVSKKWMHTVGFDFPGQTEFFANRTATENFAMCLTGGPLTVGLVTVHVPLRDVPGLVTSEEIVRVGRLLGKFLLRRGIESPRIAVAGLNPHAGEDGDMGREDIEIVAPAVAQLQADGVVSYAGPFSPDTIFFRAAGGEFDAVLCMYHDQGLIPLKLLAFDSGVNTTLGLPFPRTSPDHGTAFEIAGRSLARPDSLVAAIRLAVELVS